MRQKTTDVVSDATVTVTSDATLVIASDSATVAKSDAIADATATITFLSSDLVTRVFALDTVQTKSTTVDWSLVS